jgi:hypothetical protein
VSAAHPANGEDSDKNGHRPTGCDDDPSSALALALIKNDGCHHAVSEDNQ